MGTTYTKIDNTVQTKRDLLKAQLDDFATFQWRGHNMFDDFGCFIINENFGSLKFYNGPGFSNQYAKPQFAKNTSGLLGIDWKQQTITMKVGLYWFTIDTYQKFLDCINPYEVNYLTFDFEKKYGYLVKLGKMVDSPRYVIGKDENGNHTYYTEMELTWELLGDSCVRSNLPYEWNCTPTQNYATWSFNKTVDMSNEKTLLDTPIMFELPIKFDGKSSEQLKLELLYNSTAYETLFDISLKNLPAGSTGSASSDSEVPLALDTNIATKMFLRYDSESGLIFIQSGSDTTWHLLIYQTDLSNGDYILEAATINKCKIPGQFTDETIDISKFSFKLSWINSNIKTATDDVSTWYTAPIIYARKNIV